MAKPKENEIITDSGKKLVGEFTFKKENPRILKGIVETLANITDEGHFIIDEKEFIFEAMDPSRIFRFAKSECPYYEMKSKEAGI